MTDVKATQIYYHAGTVTRDERKALLKQTGATSGSPACPGSGKSTLAMAVEQVLIQRGHAAYVLDGDNIRFGLNAGPKILMETRGYAEEQAKRFGLGFTAADREENIRRIGEVAKLFADAGLLALTSFISPYRKDRDAVRKIHELNKAGPSRSSRSTSTRRSTCCEAATPRGCTSRPATRSRRAKGMGFTGVDDPYEPPLKPELTFDASKHSVEEGVALVLNYLTERKLIA